MRKIIKKHNIEIIHSHSPKDHWISYWATLNSNIPILRWRDIINPVPSKWHRSFIYKRGCKYLLVRCNMIKEMFIKNNKINPKKIKVIPASIDFEKFNPNINGNYIRSEFNIPLNAIIIALIAQIRPEKGHKYFIEAANYLKDRPNIYFLIVGGETDKSSIRINELKDLINKFGLKNIIFTGFRKDIPQIISTIDILVLPSTDVESVGRVILEAFAMKKPVIATSIGGIPEFVLNKKTGILIPPHNSKAIAEAIDFILNNPLKTKEMIENAYDFVKRNFSVETIVDKIEEIQNDALK